MFGFLKKKLKEGIEKISKVVSEKEEKKIEEVVEEVKKEEHIEEPKKELIKEVEKEIEKTEVVEKPFEGVKITYFVHGTTTDNEKRISSGWSNPDLSELGRKQSTDLRNLIDIESFDVIFCSDLKRAVESAKLTFGSDAKIIEDKRLRECNYGDLNGTVSDIDSIISEHINHPFSNGESYRNVENRVADFLNYLFDNYYGKHVAIVSHRAPQLALDVLIKDKSWKQAVKEDWRLTKQWQPGWNYVLENKIETLKKEAKIPEAEIQEKAIEIVEKIAEQRIEEAKKIVEAAKEVEHVEERPSEKIEPIVEKKLTATEEKKVEKEYEEILKEKPKKKLLGFLKRKPKEEKLKIEKPKVEMPIEAKPKEEAPERGIIDKIKKKVTEKKIEESDVKDILKDFETSLISSDVALEASEKIINDLKGNLVGKFIKRGEIENVIRNSFRSSILEMLSVDGFDLLERVRTKKPFVIVFLGFNGTGKTTSIARLGHLMKKNGLSCVFAAADSWRAAAIEQLEEHGRKLGIEVIKHKYGADPAAVIFDAVKHAKAKEMDVVLADTAGRSHANSNLMEELKKIIKVNKPDLKILVLDALTGNDIYDQCKLFNDAVGVDALIITKADAYEKGGAALSASFTIKKPILYLGVGQNYEDLERFDSVKIVEKLLE